MIKKILNKLSGLARAINGEQDHNNSKGPSDNVETPAADHAAESTAAAEEKSSDSLLDNAIDNRDQAVRMIVGSFRSATGTNSRDFANLTILIPYKETTYNPLLHAWADDRFIDDLRRELDNALLSAVGASKIELKPIHVSEIETDACHEVVPETIYVKWSSDVVRKETPVVRASVMAVEGTGSIVEAEYILDSSVKMVYHIGRGIISRRDGTLRRNDIVIRDNESDPQLADLNSRVSSAQADIVVCNGRFCLRASSGGCRSKGGAPTKLIRDDRVTELTDTSAMFPLESGDLIELGKSLTLLFTVI